MFFFYRSLSKVSTIRGTIFNGFERVGLNRRIRQSASANARGKLRGCVLHLHTVQLPPMHDQCRDLTLAQKASGKDPRASEIAARMPIAATLAGVDRDGGP